MNETRPPRAPVNPWWILAALAATAWVVYLLFFLPRPKERAPAGGKPADFGWMLRDLDDRPVPLKQFQGRPIFLNVWATWCPPCVGEMPSIARLASRPELKDVAFVCVSVDNSGETVKRFLEGKGWPMTVLRADAAPRVFATDGIPATFLIGPDGKIVRSEIGGRDWDDAETVALLQRLQRESTPR